MLLTFSLSCLWLYRGYFLHRSNSDRDWNPDNVTIKYLIYYFYFYISCFVVRPKTPIPRFGQAWAFNIHYCSSAWSTSTLSYPTFTYLFSSYWRTLHCLSTWIFANSTFCAVLTLNHSTIFQCLSLTSTFSRFSVFSKYKLDFYFKFSHNRSNLWKCLIDNLIHDAQ